MKKDTKKTINKRLKKLEKKLNKISDKLTTLDIAVDRLGYDFDLLKTKELR